MLRNWSTLSVYRYEHDDRATGMLQRRCLCKSFICVFAYEPVALLCAAAAAAE